MHIVVSLLAILSIVVAIAGLAIGMNKPPASELALMIVAPVLAPYALILFHLARGARARAHALAMGTALVAFCALILFAGVFTLFIGFTMGNKDQLAFIFLLDAFVLIQLPLGLAAWHGRRKLPPEYRGRVGWSESLVMPLVIAGAVFFLFTGFTRHHEGRVHQVQVNESDARMALDKARACLEDHRRQTGGYPEGNACLDGKATPQGHRLAYRAGLADEQGRRPLYALCAEAIEIRNKAWYSHVADEATPPRQSLVHENQVVAYTCSQAWGDDLPRRVKHCAVDYAAARGGYPPDLGAVGSGPGGTGCLAPSSLENLRVEGAHKVVRGEGSAEYRPGPADTRGRIASFEIHGEAMVGEWRVQIMIDETGVVHAAAKDKATRADPTPEVLEKQLQQLKAEQTREREALAKRCEAGEALLCRNLGHAAQETGKTWEADPAWKLGCRHGDGISCLLAGREGNHAVFLTALLLSEDCRKGKTEDCRRLERMATGFQTCEKGSQDGCSRLALRLARRSDHHGANQLWKKGCEAGHRESCFLLNVRDFDYKAAMELKDRCDEGEKAACAEFQKRMAAFPG